MSDKCKKLGIPDYLHQGNKNSDQNFELEELLYRRFFTKIPSREWHLNKSVSSALFELRDDSYTRSKYSQRPEDVLYNEREGDNGNHYLDAGILEVTIANLIGFRKEIDINGDKRAFYVVPVHVPTECIYPHSELHIYENGSKVDYSKPKSLKAAIRDLLIQSCTVIKDCTTSQ